MAFHVSLCAHEKKSERWISTKTLVFTIALLAGLVMAGSTGAWAQCPASPAFTPDFSNNQACLTLNPSAAFGAPASTLQQPLTPPSNPPQAPPQGVNTVLRLTPNTIFLSGSAWWNVPLPVNQHFSTTFTFQMSGATTILPGDGIAFVIQNSPQALHALDADNGADGCSIGFGQTANGICTPSTGGIPNSLAVEFDSYKNTEIGDVSANHVAIQSCGAGANSVDSTCRIDDHDLTTNQINLADGNIHTATITYTPTNCDGPCLGVLDVILDGTDLFPNGVQFNMNNLGLGEGGTAYVGFTGATGGADDNHDILSWTVTPESQTITQPAPKNMTTSYIFGTYLYKVKPDQDIDQLAVTAVLTDPAAFAADRQSKQDFRTAKCTVYDTTNGMCVEFHAACNSANGACTNVNYDVATSYDVPVNSPLISNPGFLKATGKDCVPGITFDSNIITEFLQLRNDPTTKGTSKPSFSCFVAVSNVTYAPADLDIVNLASPKVKQGANLTYVATTTNFGPSGAQGVAISNTIPAGTTYLSSSLCSLTNGCSNTSCSFAAGTAKCTVGNLDKFGLEFMLVTVKVTANPGTILSDRATISAFNPDPDRVPDRSWTMKTTVTK
jgi:uncharacterized repeat protein (TIGR01451 family)